MWFQVLPLSTFLLFDERRALAWRMAAMLGLLAATVTVGRAPYNALFLMGMAITAGVISIVVTSRLGIRDGKSRVPPSSLVLWWAIVLLVSLHTGFESVAVGTTGSGLAALGMPTSIIGHQETLWSVLALASLGFSIGFNGSSALLALMASLLLVAGLASFDKVSHATLLEPAPLGLLLSYAIAVTVLMLRYSRAMTNRLQNQLGSLVQIASDTKTRLGKQTEELGLVREGLLGSSDSQGEQAGPGLVEWVKNRNSGLDEFQMLTRPTLGFEELVGDVRTVFQEFQSEGRKQGQILGPVRFVFFPPASGYDAKADVSIGREQLAAGLRDCLKLAYESLPESAGNRREGVIRLSIRRGLRVVEIAIEDNGRGLGNQNLEVESGLQRLREAVEHHGGRFDRIARLGVGSRTSVELKILRQLPRSASYRPTLLHRRTAAEVGGDVESLAGAIEMVPNAHRDI